MTYDDARPDKYGRELAFWQSRFEIDHGHFGNSHYRRIMLAMAGEENDEFLRGKVVGDFGCGPRGSLAWATACALRIGIDVLADRYADLFASSILTHGMVYVKSTERVIPIPSDFFDVVFTLNAMDHVDDFPTMCAEVLRILKPGGDFIGGFNLEEPPTSTEPQRLTEASIQQHLLGQMDIITYRLDSPGPDEDEYVNLIDNQPAYTAGQRGYLWVRARKKLLINV
jgi:SAM-dependent methyltransferase